MLEDKKMPESKFEGCEEECKCIFQCGNASLNETLSQIQFYENLKDKAVFEFMKSSDCCWCISDEMAELCFDNSFIY